MITESNGREVFIGQTEPWEIDMSGRLVLSKRQAKELAEHLHWQLQRESPPDEDG